MNTPDRPPLANATTRAPRRRLRRGAVWLAALLVVACVNLVPQQGWDPTAGPVVPHDTFPADCELCHTGSDWHTLRADFVFDHAARTGTALEGAHAQAPCLHCHNDRGPVQQFAARGCGGCHADPHLARLGAACDDCHDQRTWVPRDAIARHDRTRFPLVGAHVAAACFRCHPGAQVGNFAGASPACVHCHRDDFVRTSDPDHVQLGFAQDCERCHEPFGWRPARFDHPASFPLTAGHAGRQCAQCHGGSGTFTGLSPDCAACHLDDFQRTTAPNHAVVGFATACAQCHETRGWRPAQFDHPASFPLGGGHAGRQCAECHGAGAPGGLSPDCASCHLDDFQRTTAPNHAVVGFPQDCAACHQTLAWRPAAFDHPATFPLTAGHAGRTCAECHTPGTFGGLSGDCALCHTDDFQQTTAPNHAQVGFPTTCTTCHTTAAWTPSTWQHQFPIVGGAHGGRTCVECHTTPGNFLVFSCTHCHEHRQSEMDDEHDEVPGYQWLSSACYQCHPNGKEK